MSDQALRVMMTARRRCACVVAVYTKDVAEAKATNGTDAGRRKGYPLLFTTEPEEYRDLEDRSATEPRRFQVPQRFALVRDDSHAGSTDRAASGQPKH
jgi:hypothetical protein